MIDEMWFNVVTRTTELLGGAGCTLTEEPIMPSSSEGRPINLLIDNLVGQLTLPRQRVVCTIEVWLRVVSGLRARRQ